MAKRKRNIQILFCVSPEEKKLIRRKMIESKTKNMGAYLRKMAIDGYIVNTDTIFLHFLRFFSCYHISRHSNSSCVLKNGITGRTFFYQIMPSFLFTYSKPKSRFLVSLPLSLSR